MPATRAAFETSSPEETRDLGRAIGRLLAPGMVVAMTGELGSGKTVLVQGMAHGLGFDGYVSSPSFVIVNEYEGSVPVYHIDLYRTDGADPLAGLGYREFFWGDGVALIEWAERAVDMLPDDRLVVEISSDDRTRRRFVLIATGEESGRLLRRLPASWPGGS
ncbi:MAG: tRNA (adenosine(37)-N6)-threonylcarbamoyltransferase complex ATPase subunit type 1 TsaE [Candidatus Eisenbacteria bacterium]